MHLLVLFFVVVVFLLWLAVSNFFQESDTYLGIKVYESG